MDNKKTSKRFQYIDNYGDLILVSPIINIYNENGNLFVGLTSYDEDLECEDLYCRLTLPSDDVGYLEGAIDTTFNGEGKLAFLESNGFGHCTRKYAVYGGSLYPIFKFKEEKLYEINSEVFEDYKSNYFTEKSLTLEEKIEKARNQKETNASIGKNASCNIDKEINR